MAKTKKALGITADELDAKFSRLADSMVADLSGQSPETVQLLLSTFVSKLFMAATRQSMRQELMEKQAVGIAKAKAKGVRFGTRRKPLPDNFDEAYDLWQSKQMTLREAASFCGMPQSTFYDAAKRTRTAKD